MHAMRKGDILGRKTKLSIIIPYYNGEPYTTELLDVIAGQVNSNVEVIVVDDGSPKPFKTHYEWIQVIRKKNGGCCTARNVGLDNAKGDYIAFIDADDLIPDYFIKRLFEAFKSSPDVIDFSWRSLTGQGIQHDYKLIDDNSWLPNPSVCTRAFKRSFIGDIRFNELKDSTEDEDFSRKVGYLVKDGKFKHASIPEYMYFYRTAVTNSKIKRFKKGIMKTKRVTYYYAKVTKDMRWLLDEIRHEDERNEVWLLTYKCEIPELKRYCQIHKPMSMWTHYLRGEPYSGCTIITPPKIYDVVMYCEYCNSVGGIGTFIFNWCQLMRDKYRILVMYNRIPESQLNRLKKLVDCQRPGKETVICDTLILNRLTDAIPAHVVYKKTVQMCHACLQKNFRIPQGRDYLINVSEAAKISWGSEAKHGTVIHNPASPEGKEALLLVSATRIGAIDKGDNDRRYRKLADMLTSAGISYIWLNFSDVPLQNPPQNFINMSARLNVQDYIKKADYLVQLSDKEAYSMAILEALTNHTAVLCTPFESAIEQGVIDGKSGYILPYDMDFDVNKLLKVPHFTYAYQNEEIKEKWSEIIDAEAKEKQPTDGVMVEVLREYKDLQLDKIVDRGFTFWVTKERAEELIEKRLVREVWNNEQV